MSVPGVLIVADDPDVRVIAHGLRDDSYDVMGPKGPLEALRHLSTHVPAVLLVDSGLRDISAGEFCALVRGRAGGTRIALLIFGEPQVAPASAGLSSADVYLSSSDLNAMRQRVRAVVRRSTPADDEPLIARYEGRHLTARFDRVEILVDGARVDLARRELALLQFLVTHVNCVLGRRDILSHVWHDQTNGRSRTIDTHIRRLRIKLGAAGNQIETVPGVGYRFSESDEGRRRSRRTDARHQAAQTRRE